jgi:hypothetical protein
MTDKLRGVHPKLVEIVTGIIRAMHERGYTMTVTDGVRTVAQQQALYAKGRTAPGGIVTNADGIVKKSNHQPHSDGLGHAVDMCFVVNGQPSWDASLPWSLYGQIAKNEGCVWGGDWHSISDRPHIELPDGK